MVFLLYPSLLAAHWAFGWQQDRERERDSMCPCWGIQEGTEHHSLREEGNGGWKNVV